MINDIFTDLLDNNYVIMIDTCFALRDEFTNFIDAIEVELLAHQKKIVVKNVVMAELYRHMGSSNEVLRAKATTAVCTICMRRNIFAVDDEYISTEAVLKAFADVEFIAYFTKNRLHHKMALLTNDYKLGKDISELNNLESCYGKKVKVFSLDQNGCLEERVYSSQSVDDEQNDTETCNVEESNQQSSTDWLSLAVTSVASFALGMVVEKYGKQIIDAAFKRVA